jgi:predicted kinase
VEAAIFIGLQGSGKSTFYQQRFASTHVRINLDTLKTRPRELALLEDCIAKEQDFVVDNTNATIAERARYIHPAKTAGYKVVAYCFDVDVKDCLARNAKRSGAARIHPAAIYSTRKRLQPPIPNEGFDSIYKVCATSADQFTMTLVGP